MPSGEVQPHAREMNAREVRRLVPWIAAVALAAGCADGAVGPDPSAEFRTDQMRYTLESTREAFEVKIPFVYRNRTGETVYLLNCTRVATPRLEKRVGGEWVVAWKPVVPNCRGRPVGIANGEAYRDTLDVYAGHPSTGLYPKFDVDDPAGTYRLVWPDLLWSVDEPDRHAGRLLPRRLRVSNEFTLKDPPTTN